MFVGRIKDMRLLEECYAADGFQMVVVYGRRRVGKTSLLHEFVKNKSNTHYFTAQQSSANENLALLSDCLLSSAQSGVERPEGKTSLEGASSLSGARFASFRDAFVYAFEKARQERTILVLDEYPYLAQSYPGVSSLLQSLIDEAMQSAQRGATGNPQLFLVLCGSSLSFMEHQVLGEKSPLYGRRTAQLRVEPFDVFDARELLGFPSSQKTVELYSLVGGIPLYLEKLQPKKSIAANISENVLRPGAYLYVEPQNFLMQAVSNPAQYNAVITAIAKGNVRSKDIADTIGQSAPATSKILASLMEMRIVKRVTPMVKAKKRQVQYRLNDELFRFWYSFAPQFSTAIEADMGDAVAQRIVEPETFSTYVGPIFEEICRQWFVREMQQGGIPLLPRGVGTWWGTNPTTKSEEEIDIVVEGVDGEILVAECKWRNEKTSVAVLDTLIERARLLEHRIDGYYLFSKSGFTEGCMRAAKELSNVHLVSVDDMFEQR